MQETRDGAPPPTHSAAQCISFCWRPRGRTSGRHVDAQQPQLEKPTPTKCASQEAPTTPLSGSRAKQRRSAHHATPSCNNSHPANHDHKTAPRPPATPAGRRRTQHTPDTRGGARWRNRTAIEQQHPDATRGRGQGRVDRRALHAAGAHPAAAAARRSWWAPSLCLGHPLGHAVGVVRILQAVAVVVQAVAAAALHWLAGPAHPHHHGGVGLAHDYVCHLQAGQEGDGREGGSFGIALQQAVRRPGGAAA